MYISHTPLSAFLCGTCRTAQKRPFKRVYELGILFSVDAVVVIFGMCMSFSYIQYPLMSSIIGIVHFPLLSSFRHPLGRPVYIVFLTMVKMPLPTCSNFSSLLILITKTPYPTLTGKQGSCGEGSSLQVTPYCSELGLGHLRGSSALACRCPRETCCRGSSENSILLMGSV